jgi:hypothetical protein
MGPTDQADAGGWAERLERLARIIPGLGPYQDREGLRETDKQVRTYVAGLLAGVARDLEPIQRALADGGRLDRLPALDRVSRALATLADRIRFASYGFTGVFALQKIREGELRALHQFDLQLIQEIPRLRSRVQAIVQGAESEEFPNLIQKEEESLRGLGELFEDRDRLARGL